MPHQPLALPSVPPLSLTVDKRCGSFLHSRLIKITGKGKHELELCCWGKCQGIPEKEVIIFEERRITYRHLKERVNALAKGLLDLGLGKEAD